jgi:hypothetical protein
MPYLLTLMIAAMVGAVLASRRPRHPVGWLLLALGLSVTASGLANEYARHGLGARFGALPPRAGWPSTALPPSLGAGLRRLHPAAHSEKVGALARWRWWARVAAAAPIVFLVVLTFGLGLVIPPYQSVVKPLAALALAGALEIAANVALSVTVGGLAVGVSSSMKNSTYSRRSQMVSTVKNHTPRSRRPAGVETPARLWYPAAVPAPARGGAAWCGPRSPRPARPSCWSSPFMRW